MDTMRQKIRDNIDKYGQHLVQVLMTKDDPEDALPFVYTIGNHEHDLPELLLVGGAGATFMDILNRLGDIQRERKTAFTHGELVSLGGSHPVRIADAGAIGRNEYAVQTGVFYRTDDYRVLQVLISDPEGRFPDDPECDASYRIQPVLSAGLSH